jgi:serine/threonine protein kinase
MPRRRSRFLDILGRFKKGKGRILRARGSYEFLKLLGRGGMGEVWLAEKIGAAGFSKLVAVKTIARHRLEDLRCLQMFLDEARLVANLVHPNIVQVYQLARTRREVYIVMEFVFGRTLLELLQRLEKLGRELPVDIGAYLVARVCYGLHYAHRKHSRDDLHLEIVHRDICPSNILISYRGIPKLTDFGVAKATTSTVDDEGNVVWGKYPYMAPEAVRREGTDCRSDIYSTGLVMYEMFAGHIAHNVDSTRALTKLLEDEPAEALDVRQDAPHIPEPLARIIVKAAHPDPAQRFQSARELATALEQFLLTHFLFPDEERLSEFLATVFPEAERHRWW